MLLFECPFQNELDEGPLWEDLTSEVIIASVEKNEGMASQQFLFVRSWYHNFKTLSSNH